MRDQVRYKAISGQNRSCHVLVVSSICRVYVVYMSCKRHVPVYTTYIYICVCVYIYIYIYTCMYVYECMYAYLHACGYRRVPTYVCVCV